MSSSLAEGVFVCALAYLAYLIYNFPNRAIGTRKRRDTNFPDVPGWPLLGQLPETIFNLSRPLELFTIRGLQLGAGWSFTLPGVRFVDISKPEWIEYVQKTNFQNYVKGSLVHEGMADVFGNGIFSTDGDLWKKTRHVTSNIFTVNSFKTIVAPSVHKSLDSLGQVMDYAVETNQSLDFCKIFCRFTLDSFAHMTFGQDLNLLSDGCKLSSHSGAQTYKNLANNGFAEAFDFAQNQIDFRFSIINCWRMVEKLNVHMGSQMKSACEILDKFAYSLVDERAAEMAKEKDPEKEAFRQPDLLGLFMTAGDKKGRLGRTELRDAVLNLIIAGRDTTAQALSWGFYHLLMNKEVVSNVRKERAQLLGNDPGERVTYDNWKSFVWTQAVVFETLRLHPSVPKNLKFALEADQIPGGPKIESGDVIRWSDWSMGRDPALWGADCGEFQPERWIDEAGKIKQFGQFKFHAFNGGPRLCLGINLALFQAVSVIIEVLWQFDLEFSPGWLEAVPKVEAINGISSAYQTPRYKPSITLPMANPMMVHVKARGV